MMEPREHCLVQLVLVFPMILSLLAFRGVQAQPATTSFDCERVGCALDPSTMGPPVCGQDGFTYHNQCLAHCQVRQRELELVGVWICMFLFGVCACLVAVAAAC